MLKNLLHLGPFEFSIFICILYLFKTDKLLFRFVMPITTPGQINK